jgi:signal transduction histidine kinase
MEFIPRNEVNVDLLSVGKKDAEPVRKQNLDSIDDRLLADVVHKIKNGLGGIGGFATLLERDLAEDASKKRLTRRIQDGVNHVNAIVVRLMTLVRVPTPRWERVKIGFLLKDEWKNFKACEGITSGHVPIAFDDEGDEMEMTGDTQLIRRMIYHAFLFIHLVGGRMESIRISPQRRGHVHLGFHFYDDISKDVMSDNIVQFMHDGEPVEARLSLAIVLKMARLHGGDVLTVSSADNHKVLTVQLKGNQS